MTLRSFIKGSNESFFFFNSPLTVSGYPTLDLASNQPQMFDLRMAGFGLSCLSLKLSS